MTEEELEWLLANSHEVRLEKGDFFSTENGPAEHFYIALAGELQVTRTINTARKVLKSS